MANNKEKRQGNYGHKNAGRKPIQDKAVPVQVYIKGSVIDAIGGIETARHIAKEAILNKFNVQTKK